MSAISLVDTTGKAAEHLNPANGFTSGVEDATQAHEADAEQLTQIEEMHEMSSIASLDKAKRRHLYERRGDGGLSGSEVENDMNNSRDGSDSHWEVGSMHKFDLLRQQMRLSSPGPRGRISADPLISNLYSTGINFDDQVELRNRRR